MAKLSNIRYVGRFKNKGTKQTVNIHTGRNMQRGTDLLFYYRQGKRVFITDREFYSNPREWEEISTLPQ